jgi:predicted transcriptional regulator
MSDRNGRGRPPRPACDFSLTDPLAGREQPPDLPDAFARAKRQRFSNFLSAEELGERVYRLISRADGAGELPLSVREIAGVLGATPLAVRRQVWWLRRAGLVQLQRPPAPPPSPRAIALAPLGAVRWGADLPAMPAADVPPGELPAVYRDILDALTREGRPMQGKKVATKAGYAYTYVRKKLSAMLKLGLLNRGQGGYWPAPEGTF